jgi:GNAT superfamily N-acetyltransferase
LHIEAWPGPGRGFDSGGFGTPDLDAVLIRRARPGEGARLRDIAIAAKAYWGYDLDRVVEWANGGDYSDEALRTREVYVAELEGGAVAWAALICKTKDDSWLDDLWVEPAAIGRGVGTALFRYVAERAKELGATRLVWEAEPNAVGFYEKLGARPTGYENLSSWGRRIPVLELDL